MMDRAEVLRIPHSYACNVRVQQNQAFLEHQPSWYAASEERSHVQALLALRSAYDIQSVPAFPGIQSTLQSTSWDAHKADEATLSLRLAALQSLLQALPPSSSSYQSEANPYSDFTQTAAPHPCTHPSKAAACFDTEPPFYASEFGMHALFATNNVSNPRSHDSAWQMQHAMPTPTSGSFTQGPHMGNPTSYVQMCEHVFNDVSSAHQQPESQGTGVFLPQPQRPLHSSSRSQAKTLFKSKAAPVTPCGSILSHTASDLSCQSSATDFCLSASESCSTVPDLDSGAPPSNLPDEWLY